MQSGTKLHLQSMDPHSASTSGSQQMPAPVPPFRPQDPKKVTEHIYQLYKPENGEPTMEILFFHGLQFEHNSPDPPYLSTWRTKDTSKEVWPATWLPEKFPHFHIFSISYDASMRTTKEHGRLDLHNLAENLVQAIIWAGIGQGYGRPVIFVGHSFGGLAIKQLWVQADHVHSRGPVSDRNQKIGKFLNNIRGVFFYGTPHHGSHVLDKAAYFLDGPLMPYGKSLNTESARLHELFASMCTKYDMHDIASVGESHETTWGIFHGLVVPEASARYGVYRTAATDHISLCKPADKYSTSFQHLITFIQSITPKVQGEASLEKIHPPVPKVAVGLDLGVKNISEMLERDTCTSLGIVGMGGVGKTTLARALVNKFGPTFECICFAPEVKQVTGTVEDVKKEMLKHMHCGSKKVEDWPEVQGKKLLVVLDDVASGRDLEVGKAIVNDGAPTSRLVVTSRNRQLLKNMDGLYDVPILNEEDAKNLFISHAFPSQLVPPKLEDHVDSIVKKCDGLPLTLEVLGNYLRGEEIEKIWKEAVDALNSADRVVDPDERLWARLKLSYIGLQEEEQQMFLDMTTFFSLGDWTLREAKAAWSVEYQYVELRWHILVDRSLVHDGKADEPIKIHEQLQSLGRKLASNGPCIRSWEPMDGWNLLQSVGTTDDKEIRSLRLSPLDDNNNQYQDIDYPQVLNSGLSKHTKVQYLDILHGDEWYQHASKSEPLSLRHLLRKTLGKLKTSSFRDLLKKRLPAKLALLQSPTLQFGPILLHRLGVLRLELPSDVTYLLGSIDQMSKLKILKIKAENLMKLPDEIGSLSQLERLTFDRCSCLETLPEKFGQLSNLKHLLFDQCRALHSLPESFGQLPMLQHLTFTHCWKLGTLPESFGKLPKLQHLTFRSCFELHILPQSFGTLHELEHLMLHRCAKLQSLPESIGQLPHLKYLKLHHCTFLDTIPGTFGQWPNLEMLLIEFCPGIKTLPFAPGYLAALRHLGIHYHRTSLVNIPDWVKDLPKLQILELGYMRQLEGFPPWLEESSPGGWTKDKILGKIWKFYRGEDGHFSAKEE